MDVNTLYGAKDFAVKTSHAMLGEFEDRYGSAAILFHVNYISGADGIAKAAARAFIEVDVNNHSLATW